MVDSTSFLSQEASSILPQESLSRKDMYLQEEASPQKVLPRNQSPQNELLIRTGTVDDIPRIQALARVAWEAAYRSFLSAEFMVYELERDYSTASLKAQMGELGHHFLVAEISESLSASLKPEAGLEVSEGRLELPHGDNAKMSSDSMREPHASSASLAGFLSYHTRTEADGAGTYLFVNKLYLEPALKGCGIGRLLLEQAMREGCNAHCCRAELMVNRSNPAVHFYRKLGFEILRESDVEVGPGFWRNDYVMSKPLSPM